MIKASVRTALSVVVALAGWTAPSRAGQDFVVQGTLLAGAAVPLVEQAAPCDTTSPLNGSDGQWIALPSWTAGRAATLVVDQPPVGQRVNDVDAYFYDAACKPNDYQGMAKTGDESGTVPAGVEYVVVNLFTGIDATFTLTVSGV